MLNVHSLENDIDAWKKTEKYYPDMLKKDYIFSTNINKRDLDNSDEVKRAKQFLIGRTLNLPTGDVIPIKSVIIRGFMARTVLGTIRPDMVPVFVKVKKIK